MTFLRVFPLPAILLLTACAVPNNPSQTTAAGVTEIELSDGRNCWNNRCFRFSSTDRSVSVPGRYPVRAPRDIDLRDRSVTEAEFAAMFQTANMAYASGVGRR